MMYLQPVNKDRLTKERRSWNMSRIRGKDTTPEKIVRCCCTGNSRAVPETFWGLSWPHRQFVVAIRTIIA
jgi:hypothetical protein